MFNFMRLPPLRRLMLMKAITGGGSWSTITGNPVSFTAKAAPLRQLEVAFSPVQDLHGYDSPWPAGGGANKLDLEAYIKSRTNNYSVDSNGWITIDDIAAAGLYANRWSVGPFTNGSCIILIDNSRTTATNVKLRILNEGSAVAETATGNPASDKIENRTFDEICFNWSATGNVTVKVACVAESTISEWTPYSNICPISGWDSLTVEYRSN